MELNSACFFSSVQQFLCHGKQKIDILICFTVWFVISIEFVLQRSVGKGSKDLNPVPPHLPVPVLLKAPESSLPLLPAPTGSWHRGSVEGAGRQSEGLVLLRALLCQVPFDYAGI